MRLGLRDAKGANRAIRLERVEVRDAALDAFGPPLARERATGTSAGAGSAGRPSRREGGDVSAEWSVGIDAAAGRGDRRVAKFEDRIGDLLDVLHKYAAVTSGAGNGRRYGARFCVTAENPVSAVGDARLPGGQPSGIKLSAPPEVAQLVSHGWTAPSDGPRHDHDDPEPGGGNTPEVLVPPLLAVRHNGN